MRLLMFFSYIGTNYRGLQRTISSKNLVPSTHKRAPDLESVQGVLEFGLEKILWKNPVTIFVSSRTDAKVHALESTVQFDLTEADFANGKKPYSPEQICQSLNYFLEKNECDIRIKRVIQVPADFNCRRASSRIYEFQLAVLNQHPHNFVNLQRLSSSLDIRDLNRCELITPPFDFRAVENATKLFLGRWDFSTFMKSTRDEVPAEKRIKTVKRLTLARTLIPEAGEDIYRAPDFQVPYDRYTFTVEGSGFLRRQVRRMVGALVGVGKGLIGPEKITWMLTNPSEKNWPSGIQALGPNGLYLKKINYSDLNIIRGYLS